MRTVEQVNKELRVAREEENQAKRKREQLEQEMKAILEAAKEALGLEDMSQILQRVLPQEVI